MAYHWDHKDIVEAYVARTLGHPEAPAHPYQERHQKRLVVQGDVLYSWGTHFPLVVPVRRKRGGKVIAWCLNGDTWGRSSGWATDNTTANHQEAVRKVIAGTGMPFVVIPFAALRSAGIDPTTVIPIENTDERYEDLEELYEWDDPRISWHYHEVKIPGTDGWVNRKTGQWVARGYDPKTGKYVSEPPDKPAYRGAISWDEYTVQLEAWRHEWENIPARHKRNGHRFPRVQVDRHTEEVELEVWEDRLVFSRTWQRHWLGESVVKARVNYRKRIRCDLCRGTKKIEPWVHTFEGGEGPLDRYDDEYRHPTYERILENCENMGEGWKPRPRTVRATRMDTACHRCRTTGRITVDDTRWAYFLSGFDANEPRPSYFFTELPPGEKPTSVAEAYDTLKPRTVALAEELGRTVHRQGDIFLIDTPTLTLKGLKAQGGVHTKRAHLLGTNHTASEVVRVGPLTYARGIIRHEPGGRRPDHVRIDVGRSWSLVLGNRTPVGADR